MFSTYTTPSWNFNEEQSSFHFCSRFVHNTTIMTRLNEFISDRKSDISPRKLRIKLNWQCGGGISGQSPHFPLAVPIPCGAHSLPVYRGANNNAYLIHRVTHFMKSTGITGWVSPGSGMFQMNNCMYISKVYLKHNFTLKISWSNSIIRRKHRVSLRLFHIFQL